MLFMKTSGFTISYFWEKSCWGQKRFFLINLFLGSQVFQFFLQLHLTTSTTGVLEFILGVDKLSHNKQCCQLVGLEEKFVGGRCCLDRHDVMMIWAHFYWYMTPILNQSFCSCLLINGPSYLVTLKQCLIFNLWSKSFLLFICNFWPKQS